MSWIEDHIPEIYTAIIAAGIIAVLLACYYSIRGNSNENSIEYSCKEGEKFPCGPWLHYAGHHCPIGHVLLNDYSVGPRRGQICIAYVNAIPDGPAYEAN